MSKPNAFTCSFFIYTIYIFIAQIKFKELKIYLFFHSFLEVENDVNEKRVMFAFCVFFKIKRDKENCY